MATTHSSPAPTSLRIAEAARHLLDAEGAEAVTMRQVAKAVGITPMAVYRHYADRAALLNALAEKGFADLAALLTRKRVTGGIEERLAKTADIFLEHALAHPRLYELMFLKPREGARRYPQDFKAGRSPTFNPTVELLQEGMAAGYFRKDDPWEIAFELSAISHGLIVLYLGGRTSLSVAQFRNVYRRSFERYLHGIRN